MGLLERISRGVTGPLLGRDVQPIEGTNANLWDTQIPWFWTENGLNDVGTISWPSMFSYQTWLTGGDKTSMSDPKIV